MKDIAMSSVDRTIAVSVAEEALRALIFETYAEQAKAANAATAESDLEAMIAEAVDWCRQRPAVPRRRDGEQQIQA